MPRASLFRTAARWIRNRRPAAPIARRVAGVMSTRNYTGACGVVDALRSVCDVLIVLDDNSRAAFSPADRCDEVLTLRNAAGWNATENLTLLMLRAFVHGCEWVVSMDDDMLLPAGLQTRQHAADLVERMARERLDVLHLQIRDLWESPDRIRTDGVWGKKTFAALRRNWFFDDGVVMQDPRRRLHSGAFPPDHRLRQRVLSSLTVYHTGSYSAAMRRGRVDRYRREDPGNRFQTDYSYILDESGLQLAVVPQADAAAISRRFRPDLLVPR